MRLAILLVLAACTRPGEGRAQAELGIGKATAGSTSVEVADGLAVVRDFADGTLDLYCSAPLIDATLVADGTDTWTITARNSLADAVLVADGNVIDPDPRTSPTIAVFHVELAGGEHALHVGPPDAAMLAPLRIAAMADIQTAMDDVDQVFAVINAVDPPVRFVVGMGDITERGHADEFDLWDTQRATLNVPFYTTVGNHDVWAPQDRVLARLGRPDFHFDFHGVAFTFVDSGDAGLDPLVEQWLDGWLAQSIDQPHLFMTHIPPIDPTGVRDGSFRSVRDADRLLARLATGKVDLTLYGHIHTFVQFENAGIPAYVSGGGGAQPMHFDGIGRHFLVVDVDATAARPVQSVEVHRVD
jgi:predicted phosphodiesterase